MKFNKLIPELSVTSLAISKSFYIEKLGFVVEYERLQDKFVFLSFFGSQIMLEEASHHWKTGELETPFGRGVNFQIEIPDPASLAKSLKQMGVSLFRDTMINSYETPNGMKQQVEFLVQDPDGYLLRFCN